MKAFAPVAVTGLLVSVASAAVLEFNQNLLGTRTNKIAFNTVDDAPIPHTLLQASESYYNTADLIPCSYTESTDNNGEATVLLAISKCLNGSSLEMIHKWIDTVSKGPEAKLFIDGVEKQLKFTTTLVPDQCEARTEREKKGLQEPGTPPYPPEQGPVELLSDGTTYRLFEQVMPGEVERISAFAKFGRVLETVPEPKDFDQKLIGVVSFVRNEKSFDYVSQLENKKKISNSFNFQICGKGESCQGKFENCVFLEESVDLFMYNPFKVTRTFECADLTAGIPVSYLDKDGHRQCFCTCPAGSQMQDDGYGKRKCVVLEPETCPCTWSNAPFGYKIENTVQLEKCEFTDLATKWRVPVPFPVDNYVADHRTNSKDDGYGDLHSGPRVDVIVTPIDNNVYDYSDISSLYGANHAGDYMPDSLPTTTTEMLSMLGYGEIPPSYKPYGPRGSEAREHYTWKDYQQNRQQKIDAISITSYGKYEISLDAHDYARDAQCTGCVAVVDKYRPKHTTQCPASFCDNTTSSCHDEAPTAELTKDNLERASGLVNTFFDFQKLAKNDACSSQRCDVEEFSIKNFYETEYGNSAYTSGETCFSSANVLDDFTKNAKTSTNPLIETDSYGHVSVIQKKTPIRSNQCTRCCKYRTELKEYWTDYTCGYDYDIRRCSGDVDETCAFEQCLVLFGDSVASTSAWIKDEVKAESEKVLAGLTIEGLQSYTQIHRALQCSSFDGKDGDCTFTTSLDKLLDVKAVNKIGGAYDEFVFWRYKVEDEGEWNLFHAKEVAHLEHTFCKPQTKIVLEAWTACGLARKFFFYVHLHVHNDIKVCDVFKSMWYQTSVTRTEIPNVLCAYPGSDFAELTFDYQPNVGLKYARDQLQMKISAIQCELKFPDRSPAKIIDKQGDSLEIIERFAVELQNQVKTQSDTKFTVSCNFTYARFDQTTLEHPCETDFTITDCNGPVIDVPHGECQWDDCAGQDKPGPFEACGGQVVRATEDAAYMTTEEVECCQGCTDVHSTCTPILGLPDVNKDIKRCVPQVPVDVYQQETYGNYQYDTGYYDSNGVVALMAKAVQQYPNAAAATGLLAASALVALVALVVVRRRRAATPEPVVEDAYYPLLH